MQPTSIYKNIPIVSITTILRHFCGAPKPCFYCKAMRWPAENATSDSWCSNGRIRLDAIKDFPEPLHSLLTGIHELSSHFKKHL